MNTIKIASRLIELCRQGQNATGREDPLRRYSGQRRSLLTARYDAANQRPAGHPRQGCSAKSPYRNNLIIWPLDWDAMLGAKRAVWLATQAIRNDAARPSPASQMIKLLRNEP